MRNKIGMNGIRIENLSTIAPVLHITLTFFNSQRCQYETRHEMNLKVKCTCGNSKNIVFFGSLLFHGVLVATVFILVNSSSHCPLDVDRFVPSSSIQPPRDRIKFSQTSFFSRQFPTCGSLSRNSFIMDRVRSTRPVNLTGQILSLSARAKSTYRSAETDFLFTHSEFLCE